MVREVERCIRGWKKMKILKKIAIYIILINTFSLLGDNKDELFKSYKNYDIYLPRLDGVSYSIFNVVTQFYNPEKSFAVPDEIAKSLVFVYSCLEKKKKLQHLTEAEGKQFVEKLIYLEEHGLKSIYLYKNYKILCSTVVGWYTFNYNKKFKFIKQWWRKHGKYQTRKEWATDRIDQLLKKQNLSSTEKGLFMFITGNLAIFCKQKKEIVAWWNRVKDKTPKEWWLSALDWAIRNLSNNNVDIAETAAKTVLYQVNFKVIENILKVNREYNYKDKSILQKVIRKQTELQKWWKNNKKTYNPFRCEHWNSRYTLEMLSNW